MLLREIEQAKPTIILVDGSGAAEAIYGLFGRMRDAIWRQDHSWVVAIDDTDRASALKPPADAFFDSVVTLEPWPINGLVDLLARRADQGEQWPSEFIASAAGGADGIPRQGLRALSDALVHNRHPAAALEARAQLLERASQVGGRPAGLLMAELLDRGQAGPSDEELQDTLGITRSRLTQLFHQLLQEHLVIAEAERPQGPGRPRVTYRPALPQ
jgi:hypothetical protein